MFQLAEKPSKPRGPIDISNITEDHVKLSWKAPEKDGGSRISAYIVEKCEARRPKWLRVARLAPDNLSVDIDNLIENVDYYFRISAENDVGVSAPLETDKPVIPKSKYSKWQSDFKHGISFHISINEVRTKISNTFFYYFFYDFYVPSPMWT